MVELETAAQPPAPLTILLFIDGLGSGGAQRQFSHLARGLAVRGHAVTVAVYNDLDHFAADIERAGVAIVRLPRPSRFSPKPIIALGQLYRRCSADVVIAFLRSPAIKAELARGLFPEMTVIVAERSAYPEPPLPLTLRLTQSLHRLAHFITVNSCRQKQVMEREFPGLAKRVVAIRNGVELPAASVRPRSSEKGELRLVAVSSLMPYKNSVRLAEALAVLRDEQGLRVTLSWLGETFEKLPSGAYAQTCKRIHKLGLEDQWCWLGVRHDVLSVLAEHDALVHPSLFEGTSNAVCEAMALGLPVLAGDVADHDEMIAQTGAGFLFDPFDVRSIAAVIAQFASLDAGARRKLGREGRSLIESRYSFDQMVLDYEILARAAARGDKDPPEALLSHDGAFDQCAA